MRVVRDDIALYNLFEGLTQVLDEAQNGIDVIVKIAIWDRINAALGTEDHSWDEFIDDTWMGSVE